jgi:hypothetical protein
MHTFAGTVEALHWLDAHAGAVTAIATLVLAAITIVYVVVTYQLVREQRRQAQLPAVEVDWAEEGVILPGEASVVLRNVGTGTALAVTLESGPGEKPEGVDVDDLGWGYTLASAATRNWQITFDHNADGNLKLPLLVSYFDSERERYSYTAFYFEVVDGETVLSASLDEVLTLRQLKRIVRKGTSPLRWLPLAWELRKADLNDMLVRADVREAFAGYISKYRAETIEWGKQLDTVRGSLP